MKWFLFLFLALTAIGAPLVLAQSSSALKPVIWVKGFPTTLKRDFPPDQFDHVDASSNARLTHADGRLTRDERQAVFKKLHWEKRMNALDEMDKDLFIAHVNEESLPALRRRYPKFKVSELAKLKSEIRKYLKK